MFAKSSAVLSVLVSLVLFVVPTQAQQGELAVSGLKVGASGQPRLISGKVIQVIDAKQMIVGIEDSRTNKGKYDTLIMVKCSTAGLTDGKFFGGRWKDITGSDVLTVTGTVTYKTVGGGTKTVFIVEPGAQKAAPTKPSDNPFVGRWKLVNGNGVTCAYVNLGPTFKALREHAPDAPGKWEIVGKEARITWEDGCRDILRLEDGKVTMLDLGKENGNKWDNPPRDRFQAIRISTTAKTRVGKK